MTYTILIHYSTGNSYGSHQETEEIGWVWTDLDKAKEALQVIKLQQQALKEINRATRSEREAIFEIYSEEYWFGSTTGSFDNHYEYSIGIKTDTNEVQFIQAFWNGYFENIISAKVITVEPDLNDMEIFF